MDFDHEYKCWSSYDIVFRLQKIGAGPKHFQDMQVAQGPELCLSANLCRSRGISCHLIDSIQKVVSFLSANLWRSRSIKTLGVSVWWSVPSLGVTYFLHSWFRCIRIIIWWNQCIKRKLKNFLFNNTQSSTRVPSKHYNNIQCPCIEILIWAWVSGFGSNIYRRCLRRHWTRKQSSKICQVKWSRSAVRPYRPWSTSPRCYVTCTKTTCSMWLITEWQSSRQRSI